MNARTVLFVLLVLLLSAAVVATVVWPLLRRPRSRALVRGDVNVQVLRDQLAELEIDLAAGTLSQAQYDEARADVSRRLLEDLGATEDASAAAPLAAPATRGNRRLAIGLAITMPVAAIAAYLWFGMPEVLQIDDLTTAQGSGEEAAAAQGNAAVTPEKVRAMIDILKQRQSANPADPQVAVMLARAYNYLRRYPEAVAAYRVALPLNPNDAGLLADYADALAMAQGRTLGPEAMKLIESALKIDPNNLKALALSGSEAFQRKDYAGAIAQWKRAWVASQGRDDQLGQQFRANILEANRLAGGKLIAASELGPDPAETAPAAASNEPGGAPVRDPAATAASAVSGRITLAAALKDRVSASDAVFIYAKAASGPPMPLAVVRARVQDLPLDFRLDDSMAMMQGLTLSRFPAVIVGARVSRTGNAVPASGDLQGQLKDVKPGTSGLQIEISEILP